MAQRNEFLVDLDITFIFAKSYQWLVVSYLQLKCHSAFLVWRILRKIGYNTLPTVIFFENSETVSGDKHIHNTQTTVHI